MDFYGFCGLSDAEYHDLHQRIDLCARMGRSFELGDCRLPEHCRPRHAVLGFWRQEGGYFVYFRPAVDYEGKNSALKRFFARPVQRFDQFEDLISRLRSLSVSLPLLPAFGAAPRDYHGLLSIFKEEIVGQDAALEAAAFKLWGHISKTAPARPLSLMFYGPTCVGKSELGKRIAPALNRFLGEERYRTVWTELNTFTEAHSVYRLTGAPPGYAGYEDAPVLESVREQPYTVFMFDELDKAHPELLKVFMSILDEGRCAARKVDDRGSWDLDFRRCVFVFTTNADLSAPPPLLGFALSEPQAQFTPVAEQPGAAGLARRIYQADEEARRTLVRAGTLREIAGRFNGLIGFQQLSPAAREAVTVKQITALGREYGLNIHQVDPALAAALTPTDALSQRSAVGILEGVLGSAFLDWTLDVGEEEPLSLAGTADRPVLRRLRENPQDADRGGLSPSPVPLLCN